MVNDKVLTEQPILIVDGYNYFIRHMVVNETVNSNGEFVGGILGFIRGLNSIINQLKPCGVIVVWEQGGPSSRRKSLNPNYKANRTKDKEIGTKIKESTSERKLTSYITKEQKIEQLQGLIKILGFMPVCQLYLSDTECDDIIAWLVKEKYATFQAPKVIVSNDKDFIQLLTKPDILIFNPALKTIITKTDVINEYNISPEQFVIARAIDGDVSDNLAGVEGVGLKTLAKRFPWLAEETDTKELNYLFETAKQSMLESKKPPKCYEKIVQSEDIIRLNYRLMLLGSTSLSAQQKDKLRYQLETFNPKLSPLEIIKTFNKLKIPITEDIGKITENWKYLSILSE